MSSTLRSRRQGPAVMIGEGGHERAGPSAGDHHLHVLLGHARAEQRVVERRRRPELAVGPVAAGAMPPEEARELDDLAVRDRPVGGIPNGSRSPWTTSVGTFTASSSARRLCVGLPARRGGSSGNAR